MTELEIVAGVLSVSEDDAWTIVRLCDVLDQEDAIAEFGYPKDTPRGRDIAALLADPAYRARLKALALDEGIPHVASVLSA